VRRAGAALVRAADALHVAARRREVRRRSAFVCIAGALAACACAEPPGPAPGAPATPAQLQPPGRAPEAERPERPAPAGTPAPAPRGDRHARAAARRPAVVKRVEGRLARSDARTVVIGSADAPPLSLRIAPGTAVTLDGRPVRPEALPPGADVRAAYRTGEGGRPAAISIDARRGGDTPAAADAEESPPARWETAPAPGPADGG
jgi:hypothetical protein